jgi:hypothetical protein
MGWNLEGLRVVAGYLDGAVTVAGLVTHSRVKYGGGVSHHVQLDEGFAWRNDAGKVVVSRPAGDTVIVDHEFVTRVMESAA